MNCFTTLLCIFVIFNKGTAQDCNVKNLRDPAFTVQTRNLGSYTGFLENYKDLNDGYVVKFLGVRYVERMDSSQRFQEARKLSPRLGRKLIETLKNLLFLLIKYFLKKLT